MAGSDNPQYRETEARSGRDREAGAEPGLLVSLPRQGPESQLLIKDLRNLSAKGLWPLGPSLFSAPGHPGGGRPG